VKIMGKFHVLVCGVPYGCQDARPDGTWLTDAQRERIQTVSADIEIHHHPASALNEGLEVPPPNAMLVETSGAEESWEDLPGVLFGGPLQQLITRELRFMQSASAGVEHLVPILKPGTALCNASGVHANAIAETVLAVMLGRAKMLSQRSEDQHDRRWRQLPCQELTGAKMCVVGTGHIGTEVARLAQAFGITTTGVRRHPAPSPYFDQVVGQADLSKALDGANFVVVACPLTPETQNLIGPEELKAFHPDSFLVNVARGAIIDEAALVDALAENRIGGAFLDAHIKEPLPADHPLWAMKNVTITPHDSHASQLMGDRHAALFCDNLARVLAGQELRNMVDISRGY
jgi:phosphoglycerate dehydrogenase-like enzyme